MRSKHLLSTLLVLGLLLGSHKGYISLFQDSNADPIQVFPYLTSMLPEADQRALNAGIPISDESMLHRLLEDYLS